MWRAVAVIGSPTQEESLMAELFDQDSFNEQWKRARDLLGAAVREMGPIGLSYSIDEFLGETPSELE